MRVADLLPCPVPWCRKSMSEGGPYMKRMSHDAYVRCDSCGVQGPRRKTTAEAAVAWNDGRNRKASLTQDREALTEVARRGIEAGIARARAGVLSVAGHELLVERFLAEAES